MSEIASFAIIVVLLIWNGYQTYQDRQERRHLVSVIVAKTPGEVRVLNNEVPAPTPPRPRLDLSEEDQEFWAAEDHHPIGL